MSQSMRAHAFNLAPFFASLLLYFIFVEDNKTQCKLCSTFFKCLPIFCLMLFIKLNNRFSKELARYTNHIFTGLIFSVIGDALLNIDLFPFGMCAFGVAQIFYINAFGWKSLDNVVIGCTLYAAGLVVVFSVFKKLDAVLTFGLPIYAFLLLTMAWRSLSQSLKKKSILYKIAAAGSLLFVVSDGFICFDMFLIKIPSARLWIMSTYYAAQFAIVLSTVDQTLKVNHKD